MTHPGDTWTIVAATALAAWGTGGSLYTRHRLRPLREATARGKRQLALAQSSTSPLAKRLMLAKAQDTVREHRQLPGEITRWHNRVHTPVTIILTVVTLGLALWGVL